MSRKNTINKKNFLIGLCIFLPTIGVATSVITPFLLKSDDQFEGKWLKYEDLQKYLDKHQLRLGGDNDWRQNSNDFPEEVSFLNSVSQQCLTNGNIFDLQLITGFLIETTPDLEFKWKIEKNSITAEISSAEQEWHAVQTLSYIKKSNGKFDYHKKYVDNQDNNENTWYGCSFASVNAMYNDDVQTEVYCQFTNEEGYGSIMINPADFTCKFSEYSPT